MKFWKRDVIVCKNMSEDVYISDGKVISYIKYSFVISKINEFLIVFV